MVTFMRNGSRGATITPNLRRPERRAEFSLVDETAVQQSPHVRLRMRAHKSTAVHAKKFGTGLLAGTNAPQSRWLSRRGHIVVTPAPGGVPPSPRQKPSGALTFFGEPTSS